ncbi:MAG TPA: TIGR03435 family protein, partial [Verrucomicrobiae bacterium]|nr:TIGR03435 family protein [Verrucomicrobiae bacterium]
GYTAALETRDTEVMALTVENPNASGLQVSSANERENANVKNGRLYFTHMRLTVITGGLEGILKTPVIDKTGLTNFYDFSLTWDARTAQQIQTGSLDNETGRKILGEWGLRLQPDTAPIEMLVVKKT